MISEGAKTSLHGVRYAQSKVKKKWGMGMKTAKTTRKSKYSFNKDREKFHYFQIA